MGIDNEHLDYFGHFWQKYDKFYDWNVFYSKKNTLKRLFENLFLISALYLSLLVGP